MKTKALARPVLICDKQELILQCSVVLRAWFVCHRLYPEQTKTFCLWVRFRFCPGTLTAYNKYTILQITPFY